MTVRRLLLLIAIGLLAAGGASGSLAAESAPAAKVLMLFSQDRAVPWQVEVDRGLSEQLKAASRPVEVYGEYLDAGRFPGEAKAAAMESFLAAKYGDSNIDVLVAEGARAGRFLEERPALLAGARRVLVNYAGPVKDGAVALPIRSDYVTALKELRDITGARKVVVLADTGDGAGKERVAQFRDAVAKVGGLEVEYLLDRPLDEVGNRLAQLGPDSVAYYLLMFRDRRGGKVSPFEAVHDLARRSAVPVFSHWTSLMGSGVAGGFMISGERLGAAAGRLALALAEDGGRPDLKVAGNGAYGSYYDWWQLRRFGIDEARLPAGAQILFRQPSFFDAYRWPIILVLSLTGVLALSVAGLLLLDVRRRQALRALAEERQSLERRVEERTADLSRTAVALERSNQELQQFAYAVSHDLQEPLRTVTGYLQLLERLLDKSLAGDAREFLTFAVDGGRRMHAMIKDLLEYSRLGIEDAPVSPVDADAALAEALQNLKGTIAERQAKVVSTGLPLVNASAPQLTRLFQNLIANALKYSSATRPPEVHVSAECDGLMWTFSVKDNGIGIPPEFGERVFGLFQRLHSRGQYDGNGVGLALCRRIVERHGGRIWVEGHPGEGSTFCFTLPVARETSRLALAGE